MDEIKWKWITVFLISVILVTLIPYIVFFKHSSSAGFYIGKYDIIVIQAGKHYNIYDVILTANHEIAHFIWEEYMNESLRQQFKEISDRAYNGRCYWGHDNETEEDFADTYALYEINQELLNVCEEKKKFMDDIVELLGKPYSEVKNAGD